jgi:RNA polymerase sigma factor (TIGR02999 family)
LKTATGDVTTLLQRWGAGDRSVESRLFELVLPDLHALARYFMRRERSDHSLQPTALLNEAYLRLVSARERDWQSRRHFYAVAARIMRRLLIDHARNRHKGQKVPIEGLEELLRGRDTQLEQAVAIDHLLDDMETSHPEWCPIVDLKFFVGCTDQEAAEALGLSLRTLQRQFGDARRWLYERLEGERCEAKPKTTTS